MHFRCLLCGQALRRPLLGPRRFAIVAALAGHVRPCRLSRPRGCQGCTGGPDCSSEAAVGSHATPCHNDSQLDGSQ
eukprot:9447329-Alexandrium_andersonii.AAC.1